MGLPIRLDEVAADLDQPVGDEDVAGVVDVTPPWREGLVRAEAAVAQEEHQLAEAGPAGADGVRQQFDLLRCDYEARLDLLGALRELGEHVGRDASMSPWPSTTGPQATPSRAVSSARRAEA